MSLENILLGILKRPAAGYDIKRQFETVFNHFWHADLTQIYRALNRMEKDGLLESRLEPSERGPARKVYQRTPAGSRTLAEWLRGGPVLGNEKFAYLAQIHFLDEIEPAQAEEFFDTLREELVTQLSTLDAIEQEWRTEAGEGFPDTLDDEDFHTWLTLDMGLRKTRALVEWVEASIARLRGRRER